MSTFTAAQVRKMAGISECGCKDLATYPDGDVHCTFCTRRAMLDAFAKWLDIVSAFEPLDDKYREEGRREVLAEIARLPEWQTEPTTGLQSWCAFCDVNQDDPHKPDCLWLRAQQVTP